MNGLGPRDQSPVMPLPAQPPMRCLKKLAARFCKFLAVPDFPWCLLCSTMNTATLREVNIKAPASNRSKQSM